MPYTAASLAAVPMRVLLLLACLTSAAASAQTDPLQFRPLAVGDTWVFNAYWGSPDPFVSWTPQSVSQYRVTGDTLVAGTAYKVIELAGVEAGVATPLCSAGVAYDAAGAPTLVRLTGSPTALQCVRPFAFALTPQSVTTHTPGTYLVGSTPTTFATVRQTRETGQTTAGAPFERDVYFAAGVGVIAFGQVEAVGTNAVAFSQRLAYARVGGTEYGANPVAGETAPATAATLRAYPNPARAALTVEADGAVRVFDALGRLVVQGSAAPGRPLRLDVSAWPAGLYVARTDAGQAVRLVVAR